VDHDLNIYCLKVGKADAFVLSSAGGTVLIDTGLITEGSKIMSFLKSQHIQKLDWLIITHFHRDHVGGAAKVLKGIQVDHVLQTSLSHKSLECVMYQMALKRQGIEAVAPRETMDFRVGDVAYTVLPPKGNYKDDECNNSTLIITVTHGKNRFLFPGDAVSERIMEYLETQPERCDFLKVPHHGKKEKELDRLLKTVQPDYAIITSSTLMPEKKSTRKSLEDVGAEVFLTRKNPVVLTSDGEHLSVRYM